MKDYNEIPPEEDAKIEAFIKMFGLIILSAIFQFFWNSPFPFNNVFVVLSCFCTMKGISIGLKGKALDVLFKNKKLISFLNGLLKVIFVFQLVLLIVLMANFYFDAFIGS